MSFIRRTGDGFTSPPSVPALDEHGAALRAEFGLHPIAVMAHFLLTIVVVAIVIYLELEVQRQQHGPVAPLVPSIVRLGGAIMLLASTALIVTGAADRVALKSARNVDGARVVPADTLNVADMLAHKTLVLTVDAVRRIEALWGGERAGSRRPVEA